MLNQRAGAGHAPPAMPTSTCSWSCRCATWTSPGAGQRHAGRQRRADHARHARCCAGARHGQLHRKRLLAGRACRRARSAATCARGRHARRWPARRAERACSCARRARPPPRACAQARELGWLVAAGARRQRQHRLHAGAWRCAAACPSCSSPAACRAWRCNLPAPLDKAAEAALPLRFEKTLVLREPRAAPAPRLQDQLSLELGRVGVGQLRARHLGPRAAGAARRHRASAWRRAKPRRCRSSGVRGQRAAGAPQRRRLGGRCWRARPTPASRAGGGRRRAAAAQRPRLAYLPTVARGARAGADASRAARCTTWWSAASRDGRIWRANVDADELNGYVEYRQPQARRGPCHARLARLNIARSDGHRRSSRCSTSSPARCPALDIVVDDFELQGRKLGPAGDRRRQPRRPAREAAPRMAAEQAEPDHARGHLHAPTATGPRSARGAPARRRARRRAAPHRDELQARHRRRRRSCWRASA